MVQYIEIHRRKAMTKHITLYPLQQGSYIEATYDDDGSMRIVTIHDFFLEYGFKTGSHNVKYWQEPLSTMSISEEKETNDPTRHPLPEK